MTDTTAEDLELFDDASDQFPSKLDLKGRLVAIWVTGKEGTRKNADGKPYPYIETITTVLDDGPDGYQEMRPDDDGEIGPNLVPSVDINGPQTLDGFQWSAAGLVARLKPRLSAKMARPMVGRINSQRNKVKGRTPSWSIAAPTDEDREIATRYASEIRAITAKVDKMLNASEEEAAFD